MTWSGFLNRRSKSTIAALAVLLTFGVGCLDYATGPHVSFSEFYLLPLALAAWWVGVRFALFIAVLSVALWVAPNAVNTGFEHVNTSIVSWAVAQLISFAVVVAVLTRLRILQSTLEQRAIERAEQLTREVRERQRLQHDLLDISEKEQRRIGQDLHDGLCQHLAGTALTCQALREELAMNGHEEAATAQKIVDLIEEGVILSRQSAKGLHPTEMGGEGLMVELEEFAAATSRLFDVPCRFDCDSPVLIANREAGEHMYRIAQEAVRNAVKHARARTIVISLNTLEDGLELKVEDDGIGFSPKTHMAATGMGLRIMPYRAHIIGAQFAVRLREGGGTAVICKLPVELETEGPKHEYAGA